MNERELRMVETLIDLRENHGVNGIKAELEAEGTRPEELIRLKDVIMHAGLGLTLKVGGGEDKNGMALAKLVGVDRVIAPMIETAYALQKSIGAFRAICDDQIGVLFAVNVETITGFANFEEMLTVSGIETLSGIVLGRVDLSGSMGLSRDDINSHPEIKRVAKELYTKAKAAGLETAMGGGVSKDTLPFIDELGPGLLDRYETRKVIFACPGGIPLPGADEGILKANLFELEWLENKADLYGCISCEDAARIKMLTDRRSKLLGNKVNVTS
ncbi:MAG: aldolase/citrate lyase family protein [Patescibacteria group bacterium]